MTADDRDGVNSNIEDMGLYGALDWAALELPKCAPNQYSKRRMLILTIRECARRLAPRIDSAKLLAACHASGLRQKGVRV